MPGQVNVYGGFNETESSLGFRNPELNETIISGNIGDLNSSEDNANRLL